MGKWMFGLIYGCLQVIAVCSMTKLSAPPFGAILILLSIFFTGAVTAIHFYELQQRR